MSRIKIAGKTVKVLHKRHVASTMIAEVSICRVIESHQGQLRSVKMGKKGCYVLCYFLHNRLQIFAFCNCEPMRSSFRHTGSSMIWYWSSTRKENQSSL